MRILWITKPPADGAGGDEIFDRKIIMEAEAQGAHVMRLSPQRVSKMAQGVNVIKGLAHYRDRYDSKVNSLALREAASGADVAICAGESFDRLATEIPCPVIPVLHNITSNVFRSILPRNPVGRLLAAQASRWERVAYATSQFPVMAVLSRGDYAHLCRVRPAETVLYTPPGMPRSVPLAPCSEFKAEILVSGTFTWYPKRRDLILFSREYAAQKRQVPVFADPLPRQARQVLPAHPMPLKFDDGIRLGLIPDRFVAGHKLKATYYIANNAIVLSYADITMEFEDIEDHEFFIRKIDHAADIERHVAEIAQVTPDVLVRRMEVFKRRCAERFSWSGSAGTLIAAAARQASRPKQSAERFLH